MGAKMKNITEDVVAGTRKRGRPGLEDEFSHLPISRQRKWQLRQIAAGGCDICGKPVVSGHKCLRHMVMARETAHRKNGFKTTYQSKSRLLESLVNQVSPSKWEYKVVSAREAGVLSDLASQNRLIQNHGREGWDLTAAMREPDGDMWFYFKRPEGGDLAAAAITTAGMMAAKAGAKPGAKAHTGLAAHA